MATASKKTIPTVTYINGGALLHYATHPKFAIAVCGYEESDVIAFQYAEEHALCVLEYNYVDGWQEVDDFLRNCGVI